MFASNGRICTYSFQHGLLNYKGVRAADEIALMKQKWNRYIDPQGRSTPHKKLQSPRLYVALSSLYQIVGRFH